jgi:hypothetical protein
MGFAAATRGRRATVLAVAMTLVRVTDLDGPVPHVRTTTEKQGSMNTPPTTVVKLKGHRDDPEYADVVYVSRTMHRGGWHLDASPFATHRRYSPNWLTKARNRRPAVVAWALICSGISCLCHTSP